MIIHRPYLHQPAFGFHDLPSSNDQHILPLSLFDHLFSFPSTANHLFDRDSVVTDFGACPTVDLSTK